MQLGQPGSISRFGQHFGLDLQWGRWRVGSASRSNRMIKINSKLTSNPSPKTVLYGQNDPTNRSDSSETGKNQGSGLSRYRNEIGLDFVVGTGTVDFSAYCGRGDV